MEDLFISIYRKNFTRFIFLCKAVLSKVITEYIVVKHASEVLNLKISDVDVDNKFIIYLEKQIRKSRIVWWESEIFNVPLFS